MRSFVTNAQAIRLDHEDYLKDFFRYFDRANDSFLKLERGQSFREPGVPSFEAFASGDWEASLRLIGQEATDTKAYFNGLRERRVRAIRVRIVELPLTPYLQWEFWVLRRNQALGEEVRVVDLTTLRAAHGSDYDVPELAIIDSSVAYEVLYDEGGMNIGARKLVDTHAIEVCRQTTIELFEEGEPLDGFFEQYVEPLPPPRHS